MRRGKTTLFSRKGEREVTRVERNGKVAYLSYFCCGQSPISAKPLWLEGRRRGSGEGVARRWAGPQVIWQLSSKKAPQVSLRRKLNPSARSSRPGLSKHTADMHLVLPPFNRTPRRVDGHV